MQKQGVIKVHAESPYEHLDPNTLKWLSHLKQMWPLWKKNAAISEMLFNFFSTSEDPFKSVLQIMVSCGDFYSGKQNSLAYHIIENFSLWLHDKKLEIPKNVKLDALQLVIRQKNYGLVKLVLHAFEMVEDKEIFIEPLKQLIKNKKYKEACQIAGFLNLHEHFTIEEFLVPLVFQDRYELAENFLMGSEKHQIELAMYLDHLIGKKSVINEAQSIILFLNIHDARLRGLNYKPLSKLLTRIIKTFNLSSSTCPNLNRKRGKGILQFLIQKRYVEKSIGDESWTEMVLEAIGDDQSLQTEFIDNIVVHGDLKEALSWAERLGTPRVTWPKKLREYKQSCKEQNKTGDPVEKKSTMENWNDFKETPALKFHKLSLQESQIKLIDTASTFENFINSLSNGISMIGIDAEWKPSFGFKKCDLALIQIATLDAVYILDVIALASAAPQNLWEQFANVLFENPNILKLGFGINADLIILKETFRRLHSIRTGSDMGFLDLAALWRTLTRHYSFVFPFKPVSKSTENLNCLIEMCLGESLDKSDQFSNWENRPLRKSQITYAALDAYCLLEAYNVMAKECESQNIPISEVIEEIIGELAMKKSISRKKRGKMYHDD